MDDHGDDAGKLMEFFHLAGKLKEAYRFSEYNDEGMRDSSAEHSWRVSLMVFILAVKTGAGIDSDKAIRIAIIHDIAEAITGDIDALLIYKNKISKAHKNEQELEAMEALTRGLPKLLGEEIRALWDEYEKGSSREARFVKAVDKMETLLYIIELSEKNGPKVWDHPEFIATYADRHAGEFPVLVKTLATIKKRVKNEYIRNNIEWKKEYDI